MNRKAALVLSLVCLFVAACGPAVTVTSDFDPSADFASLQTWDWAPAGAGPAARDDRGPNPLLDQRIREAVEASMEARGFRRSTGSPAMLIGYYAVIETKQDIEEIDEYFGWRGRRMITTTGVREYEQGTLVIDIADASSREAIWRGTGEGVVNRSTNPETNQQRLRQAVDKILAEFPPGGDR